MDSSSPSGDQWEILSESSTAEPLHVASPIHNVITTDSNLDTDDDDNFSVRSLSSFGSESTDTAASSIVAVQAPAARSPVLIPRIQEHEQMSATNNELIPSYFDIEAELQRQRELVAELKTELNAMAAQRDEVRAQRDALSERVHSHSMEIARLRETNAAINRQNAVLRQLEVIRKRKGKQSKHRKSLQSKVASITNRKGHRRSSVPAKQRFRRQRTTHRTAYCQDRKW